MSGNSTKPVVIPQDLFQAIYAEARAAFPNECCGWLTGPAPQPNDPSPDPIQVDTIRPCHNAQDSAPSRIPGRTAESAYTIEGADLLAFSHAFDGPTPPRIIYHSHPNGRAYFSATDQRAARSPWDDGPAYDIQHLVVGIDAERVTEAALFSWSESANEYVEIARFAGQPAPNRA